MLEKAISLNRVRLLLLLAILLFMGALQVIVLWPGKKEEPILEVAPVAKVLPSKIEALVIEEPKDFSVAYPDLSNSMRIKKIWPRPDQNSKERLYELTLIPLNQKKKIRLKERIYFPSDQKDLVFSGTPTTFSLEFMDAPCDKEAVFNILLSPPDNLHLHGSQTFKLPLQTGKPLMEPSEGSFVQLKKAKWLGEDLFLKRIHKEKQSFQRLQIESSEMVFLKKSDWLIYKDGKWNVDNGLEKGVHCPIAHIKELRKDHLLLEGWDNTGDQYYLLSFSLPPSDMNPFKKEELLKNIRLQTKYQVSAFLDKDKIFLREGDALIKKADKPWMKIRQASKRGIALEEKAFILFFEKVEKRGKEKFFKGSLFTPDRTSFIALDLPIQGRSNVHAKRSALKSDKFAPTRR